MKQIFKKALDSFRAFVTRGDEFPFGYHGYKIPRIKEVSKEEYEKLKNQKIGVVPESDNDKVDYKPYSHVCHKCKKEFIGKKYQWFCWDCEDDLPGRIVSVKEEILGFKGRDEGIIPITHSISKSFDGVIKPDEESTYIEQPEIGYLIPKDQTASVHFDYNSSTNVTTMTVYLKE